MRGCVALALTLRLKGIMAALGHTVLPLSLSVGSVAVVYLSPGVNMGSHSTAGLLQDRLRTGITLYYPCEAERKHPNQYHEVKVGSP